MTVKRAASKVKSVGNKVGAIIKPLGTALPVAAPNINALFSGGPRAVMDFNANAVKSWRPPDMGTVNAYIDGPGGNAIMTGIMAKLIKWGVSTLGFQMGGLGMLVDGVEDWADGSAMGYAVKELIYPTVAGGSGTLSGISFGGAGGQPGKGSAQEMATKDRKPKTRSMMM